MEMWLQQESASCLHYQCCQILRLQVNQELHLPDLRPQVNQRLQLPEWWSRRNNLVFRPHLRYRDIYFLWDGRSVSIDHFHSKKHLNSLGKILKYTYCCKVVQVVGCLCIPRHFFDFSIGVWLYTSCVPSKAVCCQIGSVLWKTGSADFVKMYIIDAFST